MATQRILLDIEEEKVKRLDALVGVRGPSRAELLRRAVDILLSQESALAFDLAFGSWGKKTDGVETQRKLREEWE